MKETLHREVVIVGSGPAGLTAAIYAARAELRPLVIHGPQPGGQFTITTEVENYPGFAEGIQGPELMQQFEDQAKRFGTEFLVTFVNKVDLSKRPFTLWTDEGHEVKAETLIVASGASAKWVGVPGEAPAPEGLGGMGVSACATCDGFFFKGKPIVVVGGGDTAMEEATFLTRYASHVTVVHRRESLRASKIMQDKAFKNPKIDFVWNAERARDSRLARDGRDGRQALRQQDGRGDRVPLRGRLRRHRPQAEHGRFQGPARHGRGRLHQDGGRLDGDEHPRRLRLRRRAGPVYRQAVTAAGTGCMAAIDAERFLDSLPVATPTGEEVTIDGEVVSADGEQVTLPDGEVVSNIPEDQPPADNASQPGVLYARPSTELSS